MSKEELVNILGYYDKICSHFLPINAYFWLIDSHQWVKVLKRIKPFIYFIFNINPMVNEYDFTSLNPTREKHETFFFSLANIGGYNFVNSKKITFVLHKEINYPSRYFGESVSRYNLGFFANLPSNGKKVSFVKIGSTPDSNNDFDKVIYQFQVN